VSDARFSPDRQFVAYSSDDSGRREVYIEPMPPRTGRLKVSAVGGSQPRWSRKSSEPFFIAPDRSMMAVDVRPAATLSVGGPQRLFQLNTSFRNLGYDVSADGQRFLINGLREDIPDTPITVVLNWWAELARTAK
jgi:dipeptidyl aminopeptidase/acylaminoacyl peptidase